MNCQECREQLSEYIDRELAEPQARDIKIHLDQCESCRRQLRLLEQMAAAAGNLPRHEPGAACLLRISEGIHRRAIPPRRTEFGPVLTFDELAEYLRVSRDIAGQYLDEIPSFEMGGQLLFRKQSVESWIASRETGFGLQGKETGLPGTFLSATLIG